MIGGEYEHLLLWIWKPGARTLNCILYTTPFNINTHTQTLATISLHKRSKSRVTQRLRRRGTLLRIINEHSSINSITSCSAAASIFFSRTKYEILCAMQPGSYSRSGSYQDSTPLGRVYVPFHFTGSGPRHFTMPPIGPPGSPGGQGTNPVYRTENTTI